MLASRIQFVALLLFLTALLACSGCPNNPPRAGVPGNTPVGVSSAPTFVVAWNDLNGETVTMESSDGTSWDQRTPHGAGNRDFGPAVAYDGALNWLLMWASGPDLVVKAGVRGSDPASSIQWDALPSRVLLPGSASPDGSPALAYGLNRWVAVYPLAGTRGVSPNSRTLVSIRSGPLQATGWSPSAPVPVGSFALPNGRSVTATSERAPALAYGSFMGAPSFLLVFAAENLDAIVCSSADGLHWNFVANLGHTEKDPAITYVNGRFFVVLSNSVGIGHHNFVYKSVGSSFAQVAEIWNTPGNAAGPAIAFGECQMIMTEEIGIAVGGSPRGISERIAPSAYCDNPGALSFSTDIPVRLAVRTTSDLPVETTGRWAARTAFAFGAATPRRPEMVLVAGGHDDNFTPLDSAELFDPASGTFTLLSSRMSATRDRVEGSALADGRAILIGPASSADFFDPATNGFIRASGHLQVLRQNFTMTLLTDGTVLCAGGFTGPSANPTNTAEVFNPGPGVFMSTRGTMNQPRAFASGTLLDSGDLLMAGGMVQQPPAAPTLITTSTDFFRFNSGLFVPGPTLPQSLAMHSAVRLDDGRILIAAGFTEQQGTGPIGVPQTAFIYNPSTNTISATGTPVFTHLSAFALLLPNGKVLIVGGESPFDEPTNLAELFDPATNTFHSTRTTMTAFREDPSVTLLSDGRVLIAGGSTHSGNRDLVLRSAEIYDFRTDTFTPTANMNVARALHTAVAVH